jgi:hypothetical protein
MVSGISRPDMKVLSDSHETQLVSVGYTERSVISSPGLPSVVCRLQDREFQAGKRYTQSPRDRNVHMVYGDK